MAPNSSVGLIIEAIFAYFGFKLKKAILLISFIRLMKFGFINKEKMCYMAEVTLVVYGFGFEKVLIGFLISIFAAIIETAFLIRLGKDQSEIILNRVFGE